MSASVYLHFASLFVSMVPNARVSGRLTKHELLEMEKQSQRLIRGVQKFLLFPFPLTLVCCLSVDVKLLYYYWKVDSFQVSTFFI